MYLSLYYKECKNSIRNNGNNASMVIPVEIKATVNPLPTSDLKNTSIVAPSLFLLPFCSDVIIPNKYFKTFTEVLFNY